MESILNQFASEHAGLITIASLIFTIISTILAVYGIHLAKGQPSGAIIMINSSQTPEIQPKPTEATFLDSLLKDDNMATVIIVLAIIGALVKGKYSLYALAFSVAVLMICIIVVIVSLLKARPHDNLLKKYFFFFTTFIFSAISIWGFAFPLFDSLQITSDISSLPQKVIYYIFSGMGYSLCIACIIENTISLLKHLKWRNQTHRNMWGWLFLAIIGAFLQSGVLTAFMYHILDFN